jgi:hypothetical protein
MISDARSDLNLLKSVWCATLHLPLQLQYSPHMRHLLAFKPMAVHMSFDVAKFFAVMMSERRGNLFSFLARWSSTSFRIVSHPVQVRVSGWAAAVAALRSAACFLDVEVDVPPLFPPSLVPFWVGGGAFGAVRGGAKIGL